MADANDYLIPFGIDSGPFFNELNNINNGTRQLAQNVNEATRQMQNGFNQATQAGENLSNTIQTDADQTRRLSENMRNAGRDIQNALSGNGVGNQLESRLQKYTELINQFSTRASRPIKFDIDTAKLQVFEQMLEQGAEQMEVFNQVIQSAKDELATLSPDSEKWAALNTQIQTAEDFLTTLGVTATQVNEDFAAIDNTVASLGPAIAQAASMGAGGLERLNTIASQLESTQSNLQQAQRNTFDPELVAQYDEGLQRVNADLALVYQALDDIQHTEPAPDPVPEEAPARAQSMRTRLREMREEMTQLAIAGQQDSDRFRQLQNDAGALADEIGDVQGRIRALSSDTKYLDAGIQAVTGLTGAFTAAQGAVALFGGESKETQEIIQKVTGAMAILQGIQAVANALNKDGALATILLARANTTNAAAATAATVATAAETVAVEAETVATVEAAVATRSFTAALLANPLTLIAVAVVALVTALVAYISSTDDAAEKTEELNDALERQNELLGLDEQGLTRRTNIIVAQLKAQGAARAAAAKTDSEVAAIQAQTEKAVNEAQLNALNERLALQKAAYAETTKLYNDDNADKKKLGDALIKQEQDIKNTEADITVQRLNTQAKAADDERALNKKRADEAKQATEKAKQEAAKQQAILEQQTKYAKQLRDAETASLTDNFAKQRAQAIANTQSQIEQLQADKQLSVKATEERDAIILQLRKNLTAQLGEITKEETLNQAALQLEASKTIEDLQKESGQKQLEQLRLNFEQQRAEIQVKYKDQAALLAQLLDAINKAEIEQTRKLATETTVAAIDKETERQTLLVETAAKYIGPAKQVEEEKQLAILQVQLEGANKRLQALRDGGEAETSEVVLQAKKQVQDLQKEVTDQTKTVSAGKGIFNLQTLLFGDHGDKDNQAIKEGLQKAGDAVKEITSFIVDQYQRQIDKKQEVIDQYDKDLDDLESQLDKEQSLRDQGYANNVEAIENEIAAKKQARDEELKQQQEIQNKQKAAAKVQFAIDTAMQASNLITASTQIFSTFAAIPFGIGIPLAIAVIAAMIGAFVSGKVKMYQAIQSGQTAQFGEGGWIEGKSHAAGGRKYRADDGSGDVMELEGDEYVVRKSQAKKRANLLEGINSGMTDAELAMMLAPMGIHLPEDDTREAIQVARERDQLRAIVVPSSPDNSGDMKAIRNDVNYLAVRKRNEIDRWEDDKYYYERKGNKTTKIKKAKT